MEVTVHIPEQNNKESINHQLSALYLRISERLLNESTLSAEDKLNLLQELK